MQLILNNDDSSTVEVCFIKHWQSVQIWEQVIFSLTGPLARRVNLTRRGGRDELNNIEKVDRLHVFPKKNKQVSEITKIEGSEHRNLNAGQTRTSELAISIAGRFTLFLLLLVVLFGEQII